MLDEILARLGAMSPEDRERPPALPMSHTAGMRWVPAPGPQTNASGALPTCSSTVARAAAVRARSGLGLAFTAHRRSLILRRRYVNLDALMDRRRRSNGGAAGFNGSPPPRLLTGDNRLIVFGANQHPGDEQNLPGPAVRLKVFDEATQFLESQAASHRWLRSTEEGHACAPYWRPTPRSMPTGIGSSACSRPGSTSPIQNPAKHGELRWFVTAPDGADLEVPVPIPSRWEAIS